MYIAHIALSLLTIVLQITQIWNMMVIGHPLKTWHRSRSVSSPLYRVTMILIQIHQVSGLERLEPEPLKPWVRDVVSMSYMNVC
ncbi:hypothetical protein C8R42DRAFT_124755 [Lentinula raphanica]|nr:hypothetical protein C8R42DRAFT_124755 [Lentinula raphanica]